MRTMNDLYGVLFRKILYPLYEQWYKGRQTLQALKDYQKNLGLNPEQLAELQWQKLKALLNHAYQNVPYYQNLWRQEGINPEDIRSVSDFTQLPILTKQVVTEHYDQLRSKVDSGNNITKTTGGSSGVPFKFEITPHSNELRQAVMWRGYGWLGAGLGVRTAYLWGTNVGEQTTRQKLKDSLYHRFYNRMMLNSFNLNADNLQDYVDSLNQYKARAMVCYVAPLTTLAQYINEQGVKVHSPDAILTGAEPLYEFQRQEIQKAFQCPVYNTYGCREVMLIAAECKRQNGLHINMDHLVVEVTNESGSFLAGRDFTEQQTGDILITDLSNWGMPLIRYQNGDLATLTDRKCGCGNPLPLMDSVDGRSLDVIVAPNGARLPGEFFPHLLKEYEAIKKFQVVQDTESSITIKYVTDQADMTDVQSNIRAELDKYTQGTLAIEYVSVDEIPLTVSGKHRVVINQLKQTL